MQVSTPRAIAEPHTGVCAYLRGVAAIRLSVLTDETTSPARQLDGCHNVAGALSIDIADRIANDLDVSASKLGPFDRPELGEWLRRPDDFDALIFWRFDRAIRSMADMHALATWARLHRKMLVFAEGIGGTGRLVFDFRNPMDPISELMMMMFAFAAQVEATSIRERVIGAHAAMRTMPYRWPGGKLPFGYTTAPMPAEHGSGVTLVPDPHAVKLLTRIIRDILAGLSASAIAAALNAEGALTWRDYLNHKASKPLGGKSPKSKHGEKGRVFKRWSWCGDTVTGILRSPALLGWKLHKGQPVRDAQGAPVLFTETPLLTREEYDAINAILAVRADKFTGTIRRDSAPAMLLRVIHCHACTERMYLSRKSDRRAHDLYHCNPRSRGMDCNGTASIRAEWVHDYVEREFLKRVGHIPYHKVTVIPGYDPAPEIAATRAEFDAHQEQEGRQKSRAGRESWQARADALDARLAELEATPARPERREVVPTGRTYADDWHEADTEGKRAMLLEAGAKLTVRKGPRAPRELDESLVEFTLTGELDSIVEESDALADAETDRPTLPTPAGTRVRLNETVDQDGTAAADKLHNSATPVGERRNVSVVLPESTPAGKPRNDARTVDGWPAITRPRDGLTVPDPAPTGAGRQRAPIPA
ncbi:recombinase family protein [Embleya sp. AB8]|uniref:recombinase family protein n=1 Tax=Embleya sp. AB8 TaxID=3156304 RepID=UPI003C7103AC